MLTVATFCVEGSMNAQTYNGHAYVDLGLPSGTLWATCNIGADKPGDYGNYYAWGETERKDAYEWETYRYANGSMALSVHVGLTKYCNNSEFGHNGFTDNLTELQASDDPATANWGNGWHTPTMEQWEELLDNTTNQWTTKNGVEGRLFTAKNGKTLFLPDAGDLKDFDSEFTTISFGGHYWSRSLVTDYPNDAWGLHFGSESEYCIVSNCNRSFGLTVRPVCEK